MADWIATAKTAYTLGKAGVSVYKGARKFIQSSKKRKLAYSQEASVPTPSKRSKRSKTRETIMSEGRYNNRLSYRKPVKPVLSKYDLYGSRGEDESYGTINRPECAYIGITSAKGVSYGDGDVAPIVPWSGSVKYHVACALLRKILKREFNFDVSEHSQHLQVTTQTVHGSGVSVSRYPSIWFIAKQMAVGLAQPVWYSYELNLGTRQDSTANESAPKTFGFVALEICKHVFSNPEFGGVSYNVNMNQNSLYGYTLVRPTALNAQMYHGNITRLDEEYVKAFSTAELMIQNVTQSDNTIDAGTRLADRIDANPLTGRVYKFTTAYPEVRQDGVRFDRLESNTDPILGAILNLEQNNYVEEENSWRLMYDNNGDGVIVPGAALVNTWTQLPPASVFKKCSGVSPVSMVPGSIQKLLLRFKFDGKLIDFIKGFRQRAQTSPARAPWDPDAMGTSVVVALEKTMTTGSSTDVSINYSSCYWAGAYMKRSKKNPLRVYNKSVWHVPAVGVTQQGTYINNTYTGNTD